MMFRVFGPWATELWPVLTLTDVRDLWCGYKNPLCFAGSCAHWFCPRNTPEPSNWEWNQGSSPGRLGWIVWMFFNLKECHVLVGQHLPKVLIRKPARFHPPERQRLAKWFARLNKDLRLHIAQIWPASLRSIDTLTEIARGCATSVTAS